MTNRYHPYSNGAGKGGGKPWSKSGGQIGSSAPAPAPAPAPWHGTESNGATSKICSFFLQGSCRKGAYCDFAHIAPRPEQIVASWSPGPEINSAHFSEASSGAAVKRKMCAYFVQGLCKKGDACDFAHYEHELQAGVDEYPSAGNVSGSGEVDTRRTCTFFLQGNCKKGDQCDFAHRYDEAVAETGGYVPEDDARYKTQLCRNFAQSSGCPRGDACSFAHGEEELRGGVAAPPRLDVAISASVKNTKKMCDDWLQGFCSKGDACDFIHGKSSASSPPWRMDKAMHAAAGSGIKNRLCSFFMQDGFCKKGIECDFAHGEHELEATSWANPEVVSNFDGASAADSEDARYKTVLCRHFTSSTGCERGAACSFAHGPEELRQSNGTVIRSETAVVLGPIGGEPNTKKMCDDWLQGLCRKGDACIFIHGKSVAAGNDRQVTGTTHESAGPALKSRLCTFFMEQGFCKKGAECDFAHGEHELQSEEGQGGFKRRLCSFFAEQGFCKKGASCDFAHGEHELQSDFDESGSVSSTAASIPGYKSRMCKFFLQGCCEKGDSCTFSHGQDDFPKELNSQMEAVEPNSQMEAVEPTKLKTKLCNFFARGYCERGVACTFAHGEKELAGFTADIADSGSKMCRYFLQGSCKKGDDCDFSHGDYPSSNQAPEDTAGTGQAKRRLCHYFIQGICKKGNACTFSHDPSELDPNEAPRIVKPPAKPIAETVAKRIKVEEVESDHGDPDDWEALEDEDGGVYYHHMPSGRTQWEPPKLPPILQAGLEVRGIAEVSIK